MLATKNDHYIGSTIHKLNQRISQHKYDYNSWLNEKKHYCNSFEIIKNDNYEVIEIEEVEKETKEACREREQNWIEFFGKENLINKGNAVGFDNKRYKEQKKEYCEINKDKKKQYDKEYYENNKEEIRKQQKEYYEKNK